MATLTARESEILTLAWECFKSDPQVNYASLAEHAGLKNAASATTAYLGAKKKMLANGTSKLTAREREILALAWKCFNTPPKVDYNKLAGLATLKNAASATTAFLGAKKKMLKASEGNDGVTPSAKKRKNLPSARNQSGSPEAVVGGSNSPVKKELKRANAIAEPSPKSAAVLAAVESAGEDEGQQADIKPAKRARKGKKARSEMIKSEPGGDEVDGALYEPAKGYLKQEEQGE